MSRPSCRQKKQDDTPDWYIAAHNTSMNDGLAIIIIRDGKEPQHLHPDDYSKIAQELLTLHKTKS